MSKYRLTKPAMGWPHVVREIDEVVMTPGELIKELNSLEQRLAAAEAELEQYRTKRLLCWDEANPEHGSYDERGIAEYFADNMADDKSLLGKLAEYLGKHGK